MNIFSIIVIYNGMKNDWIEKCFNSLLKSDISTNIIAIDNFSTDESVTFIKSKFPNVELIQSPINLGFGGANNLGIISALKQEADYFFLLNQDAFIEIDTISKLIKCSKKYPEYGVISPLHLDGTGASLDYKFSSYVGPAYCKNFYSDFVLNRTIEHIYPVDFICAAAWLITKECIEIVGGFSPTFFHYGEDDNFCQRMKFKQIPFGLHPLARIYHDRKDRDKSQFETIIETEKRRNLLYTSNPNKVVDIKKLIKQYRNKLFKNKLFRNIKEAEKNQIIFSFLQANEKMILENLDISMSTSTYMFLEK